MDSASTTDHLDTLCDTLAPNGGGNGVGRASTTIVEVHAVARDTRAVDGHPSAVLRVHGLLPNSAPSSPRPAGSGSTRVGTSQLTPASTLDLGERCCRGCSLCVAGVGTVRFSQSWLQRAGLGVDNNLNELGEARSAGKVDHLRRAESGERLPGLGALG